VRWIRDDVLTDPSYRAEGERERRIDDAAPARGDQPGAEPPEGLEPLQPEHAPAARSTHRRHPQRRVLLVDDNEDALVLLGDALAVQGYDVTTAPDPESALDAARTFRPEVAILDIGLPQMDGYELGARLRSELGDAVSLIALTGYGQPSDRTRSEQAGFRAHFVKPVDIQRLCEAIAEV
jgi:CheY-like chemotaxis protein